MASAEQIHDCLPELDQIAENSLRAKVVTIWVETWRLSNWADLREVPKNPITVRPERSLVDHTRAVTSIALAMADTMTEVHGLEVNRDWVAAGALLHDVSKLLEFEPEGRLCRESDFGHLIQHGVFGVHMCLHHDLPMDIGHIVGSHTTQSRLPPRSTEAVIVHYADYADSDALMLEAGSPLLLLAGRL